MIRGVQPVSLVDYPGNVCAAVFTGGCNFRCPACHNRQLVLEPQKLPATSQEELLSFLKERRVFLDGVCITGGEPTIHGPLPELAAKIRGLGLKVKLDTNGSNPRMLARLLADGLVDFVAMDFKAAPENYPKAAGVPVDIESILQSARLIIERAPSHEFRTTFVPGIVSKEDLPSISSALRGAEKYVIQQFRPTSTVNPSFEGVKPYPVKYLEETASEARRHFRRVELRQ